MKSGRRAIAIALALVAAVVAVPLLAGRADWEARPSTAERGVADPAPAAGESLESSGGDALVAELERIEAALAELPGASAARGGSR